MKCNKCGSELNGNKCEKCGANNYDQKYLPSSTSKSIKRLAATALAAALVFIFTRFFQIPIIGGNGYIHPGDSMIYLFACILPMPYSLCAASIGASLADVTSGYAAYAIPTIIIKALMASCFSSKKHAFSIRNIVALLIATIVLVLGYYIAEVIMYDKSIALVNSASTAIQGAGNAVIYIVISVILTKVKAYNTFKEELA